MFLPEASLGLKFSVGFLPSGMHSLTKKSTVGLKRGLLLVFSGLIPFFLVSEGRAESSAADRLVELKSKIETVSAALQGADPYPAHAGKIDVWVAEEFARYIAWELAHPDLMKEALVASQRYERNVVFDETTAATRYTQHIDHELSASMEILDQAMSRLNAKELWPTLQQPSWDDMQLEDGYFRVKGRAVFPGGFNMIRQSMVDLKKHPEWVDKDAELMKPFFDGMRSVGVGMFSHGISPLSLIMEDGSIDKAGCQKMADRIREVGQLGVKVSSLFHWGGNPETLEAHWPGIKKYYGNGVYLDIDHPGVQPMVASVMAELMPILKDVPELVAIDLANEPFFEFEQWSPHSLTKYRAWLKERHTDIATLNTRWKTTFKGFSEVPHPGEGKQEDCSAGEWYDQVTFHNIRVNDFFTMVATEVHKHHPTLAIHLKAQDNSSLGPRPGSVRDGIDRELLSGMSQLQGVDTRPLPITDPRMASENYDASLYGFHWLGQSFLYDYLTSLQGAQPIVDFEYHAFSINPIRVTDIPANHARASLWMAHLHGMIGNNAWYWHRRYGPNAFPAIHFSRWFHASLSTQPRSAAAYFHTMLELNAFAPAIEALASEPRRPIRLLVSKPSYVQNQKHIDALHRVYEACAFHGLRVGFLTEKALAATGIPDDCELLILPDISHVHVATLDALKAAKTEGLMLLRYGKEAPRFDAYAQPHPTSATAFLTDVDTLKEQAAPQLSAAIASRASGLTASLPLRVRIDGRPDAFPVMHRTVKQGGETLTLLVNLSDRVQTLHVSLPGGRPITGYDLINRESVEGAAIVLPVQGVRLIRLLNGS